MRAASWKTRELLLLLLCLASMPTLALLWVYSPAAPWRRSRDAAGKAASSCTAGGVGTKLNVQPPLQRTAGTLQAVDAGDEQALRVSPLARLFSWAQAALSREKDGRAGVVVRCGAKGKPDPVTEPQEAKARSPAKHAVPSFMLTVAGVSGDYNQYRSEVLRGAPERAVSILTTDILQALRREGWTGLGEGELGENVLVGEIPYDFFVVGRRYMLGSATVEITEPIQPCKNLCRLPFLKANLPRCTKFINTLMRRWAILSWQPLAGTHSQAFRSSPRNSISEALSLIR